MVKNYVTFIFILTSFQSFALKGSKNFPVRKLSLIATAEGFYPDTITAFKGETLQLFFTSTEGKKKCALIKNHNLFLSSKKGNVSIAQTFLPKSGEFKIYCPSSAYEGKLVVLERKNNRSIASEEKKEVGPWVPKDYSE